MDWQERLEAARKAERESKERDEDVQGAMFVALLIVALICVLLMP